MCHATPSGAGLTETHPPCGLARQLPPPSSAGEYRPSAPPRPAQCPNGQTSPARPPRHKFLPHLRARPPRLATRAKPGPVSASHKAGKPHRPIWPQPTWCRQPLPAHCLCAPWPAWWRLAISCLGPQATLFHCRKRRGAPAGNRHRHREYLPLRRHASHQRGR